MNERFLYPLGIIGGYSSGALAYFNVIKDVAGFVGVVVGAALSIWALYDRIQRWRRERKQK